MIPGLDKLIDAILGIATSQLQDRIQRSEAVIKLLKRLNLDPEHPRPEFSFIYQYALVEYGVGKPKPVLDLFRRSEIQQTFRQAFEQNNFPLLERVSLKVIEANQLDDQIQQLGIDWRRELVAFSAVFIGVAKRSRTPAEVLRDQQSQSLHRSLHQHLVVLQERLDRLPTLEGIRTEMARLAAEEVLALPAAEQSNHWAQQCRAYALSQQMRGWFETLGFRFEAYEVWQADYFEWIINVPVRRGRYDRILIRGMDGEAELSDVAALRQSVEQQRTDEGWLVTARRISRAARDEVEKSENQNLGCYTLDELLDQDADFTGYLDWLEQEIQRRQIDRTYVPLACTKEEFDPLTKQRIGTSTYDERDGWIDGYIDLWLDDPAKEHISILGEFGTGKTWFALHYAWQALQRYKQAKRRGLERPRLPLVIPLRDYAKAVSVESLFSEFFFRKYEIPIPGYSVFEQLNRMGKLLLIFDGFDEMAARVDRQEMINNFWELAKVVVPGAKVILTCRTEHFPEAKEGRALLNAELQASTKSLTGETPQFEVLELEKFSDQQIQQVLSLQAQPATVEQVMGNPQLLDLARRPVMTELILEALPDIEAGKPIDMSRIYLYAVRRKMERDIKAERTFTSMAEKLYFLCELSWEMLSTDRMSLNYREFPDRIRRLFGSVVQEEKDLDHWHYDMMGQTMLIRNSDGDYTPAHRSLLEFFVAYKFAAELGALAPDFLELAQAQSCLDTGREPQDYTWSGYFQRTLDETGRSVAIAPLKEFVTESFSKLRSSFGCTSLAKAVFDLLLPMLKVSDSINEILLSVVQSTQDKTQTEAGYVGGNAATLLIKFDRTALREKNLSRTVLCSADFTNANLYKTDLSEANLINSSFVETFASIYSVAFSPDGKILAASDSSGRVYVWRTSDNKKISVIKTMRSWVLPIAFSPDSQTLASGGINHTVKLWSVVTGKLIRSFYGHLDTVRSIAISSDGKTFVSGSEDHTMRLWDMSTGQCLRIFYGHTDCIRSVAISSDGQTLASGSEDHTVKLWNVHADQCVSTLDTQADIIRTVDFHPKAQILASNGSNGAIKLWDITGKLINTLIEHTDEVRSIAFNSDGEILVSASQDRTIKLWDTTTRQCIRTFSGHTNFVNSLTCSPVSQVCASGSHDQSIRLWDLNTGQCLRTLKGYTNWIWSIVFSSDNKLLVSAGDDGILRIWDVETGQCIKTIIGHTKWIWSVAFSPDNQYLASGSEDTSVKLWDAETGKYIRTLQGHTQRVRSVAFSPKNSILATGSGDKTIKLWNVNTGECFATLQQHIQAVESVAFSPDGKLLVSGGIDRKVLLWDLEESCCIQTFQGHTSGLRSVAFSSDGKLLISGSDDTTVKLWSIETNQCFKSLNGHTGSVPSTTFDCHDQIVISGSADQMLKIWNVSTGNCVKTLQAMSEIWSVALSSDNRLIASSGQDETIQLWDAKTGEHLRALKPEKLYEGMNITGVKGLTEAEKASLKALGAVEEAEDND